MTRPRRICLFSRVRAVFIFTIFLLGVASAQAQSSPTPSPTPTFTPDGSRCPGLDPGYHWHYAGVWHFAGFGDYEPRVYTHDFGFVPARRRICYFLDNWSYWFTGVSDEGHLGPYRDPQGRRWGPGFYASFLDPRDAGPLVLEIRTGRYYLPGSASGSLYIWVSVADSPTSTPTASPSPSPTASPSPTSSPAPSVDCTRWVDVDDSPASHTLLTFVLVCARGVHIRDIPVRSGRRFSVFFGSGPVLPDSLPDADLHA